MLCFSSPRGEGLEPGTNATLLDGIMDMKRSIFIVLLLCSAAAAGAKTREALYRVAAASAPAWVVVRDIPADAAGATVYTAEGELPSQLDDLDGDGRFDELVFRLETVGRPGDVPVRVVYSTEPVAHDYKPMVNAQMWWKNPDRTLTEKSRLSSEKDDMYRKLHHHGPAFESEYAAYRIYFDKKQSIDTYGKKRPALELRETMWYPSDAQLAAGCGHDNLRVFGSVSVGALKGWNASERRMEHIVGMRRREAVIRAYGPLRTVVDMRVEGWRYCGREIDMTSRYILYGGGSVVKVENRIEGENADSLEFTTGVMKMAGNTVRITRDDREYRLETMGCDFPENDTLKWERETVYLSVWLPADQVSSQIDDAASYLCQLHPSNGRIDYWFVMGWRKSAFPGRPEPVDFRTFRESYSSDPSAPFGNAPYREAAAERVE